MKAMAAVGGARGRPCDACGIRRARWFCAADDASLCGACDTSVHSANSVACRHERLKLEPSQSDLRSSSAAVLLDGRSSWPLKGSRSSRRPLKPTAAARPKGEFEVPSAQQKILGNFGDAELCGLKVEELGLDCFYGSERGEGSSPVNGNLPFEWLFDRVKVEVSDEGDLKVEIEDELPEQGEPFDLNIDLFDFVNEDEEGKVKTDPDGFEERKICLTLDYEAVLNAWSDRGSPWADENTLRTFLDDSGSEGTGGLEYGLVPDLNLGAGCCGERIGQVPVMGGGESQRKCWGGREARVMRYREKRQSRLFSKRIRYEVRKLNAEKRPRLKGRFVKKPPEVSLEGSGHRYKR